MTLPPLSLLIKYYSLTSHITHLLPKYSLLHRLLLSYKSLLLVCNLQICVSFLPDIFPSQVFFVFSWLPPCFQKFIWQVRERMYFLHIIKMNNCYAWQQKKDTFHWYFYQKRSVPLYTLFLKMLLKNNQYFTCKHISQTVKNP